MMQKVNNESWLKTQACGLDRSKRVGHIDGTVLAPPRMIYVKSMDSYNADGSMALHTNNGGSDSGLDTDHSD